MALQQATIGPSGEVLDSGTTQAIISYSGGTPGGTTNGNLSDSSDNTGVNFAAGSWILFDLGDSPVAAEDCINSVQVHARWSSSGSSVHISLWFDIGGTEYASVGSGGTAGPSGDTWFGTHLTLAERTGIDHPFEPAGPAFTLSRLHNLRIRPEVWGDSDGVAMRDVWVVVKYWRQPTVSGLAVSGLDSQSSGRVLSWTYTGDRVARLSEVYVYAASATPGDAGYLTHTIIDSAATSYTLPARTADGTYYVYIRSALQGAANNRAYSEWVDITYDITGSTTGGLRAPTLLAPTNHKNFNVSASGWFTRWRFNSGITGDAQSDWALRRNPDAGGYEYFDISDRSWSGTIVWNSGAAASVTWQASEWSLGVAYTWSVATKNTDSGAASPFAADFDFSGIGPPSVTVTAPSGSVGSTNTPDVEWTYSGGDPQDIYEAKVFTYAQTIAAGFNPETTTPVWTSFPVASTDEAVTIGKSLDIGTDYVAYVRVMSGGLWSTWDYSVFDISVSRPAAPTITDVVNNVTYNTVQISAGGGDFVRVEYSDDEGVNWYIIRNGAALPSGGSVEIDDYEVRPRTARWYRAFTWEVV